MNLKEFSLLFANHFKNGLYDLLAGFVTSFKFFSETLQIDQRIKVHNVKKVEQHKRKLLLAAENKIEDKAEAEGKIASENAATPRRKKQKKIESDLLSVIMVWTIIYDLIFFISCMMARMMFLSIIHLASSSSDLSNQFAFINTSFIFYTYVECILIKFILKILSIAFQSEVAEIVHNHTYGTCTANNLVRYLIDCYSSFFYLVYAQYWIVFVRYYITASMMSNTYLSSVAHILHLVLTSMYYSVYIHDYIWSYRGVHYVERLSQVEKNWPFFVGFGMIPAIVDLTLDGFLSSFIIQVVLIFPIVSATFREKREKKYCYKGPAVRLFIVPYYISGMIHIVISMAFKIFTGEEVTPVLLGGWTKFVALFIPSSVYSRTQIHDQYDRITQEQLLNQSYATQRDQTPSRRVSRNSPAVSSRNSPSVPSRNSPAVTSRNSPAVTSRNSPSVSSRNSSTAPTRNSPAVTSRNSPAVTSRNSPAVTLRNSPAVTLRNSPSVTSRNSSSVTSRNSPSAPSRSPFTSMRSQLHSQRGLDPLNSVSFSDIKVSQWLSADKEVPL